MIEKGRPWGREIDRPRQILMARSDAELADIVTERLSTDADTANTAIAAVDGDLARTLGHGRPEAATVRSVPLDVVRFRTESLEGRAVAHLVARPRRSLWLRGPILAVMNAEHLGHWDVIGRGHPNDGRVEILEVDPSMSVRQRLAARRRLPTGTHLPHPAISVRSAAAARWDFERPRGLWVDGRFRGTALWLEIEVDADAYELIIG